MDSTTDELYFVRRGKVLRCFDAILQDADEATQVNKSSATQVSEYIVNITTLENMSTYKNYTMALNELEATFDVATDALRQIELRDTAVNKKLTFLEEKATLTNARGQDTVGKNSEVMALTTVESIHSINVNGKEFVAPIDLPSLYEHLTGVNLENRGIDSEELGLNWWTAFLNKETVEN